MNAEVAVFGFTLKPVTYTYKIPARLTVCPGFLVNVPFGKKKRFGIVVRTSKNISQFDLKEIDETVSEYPLLEPSQLLLAEKLAAHYFISTAEALHLMLPKIPNPSIQLSPSLNKKVSQELFLFPTLNQAREAQRNLGGLVFSHSGPNQTFSESWQKIQTGQIERILGSRSALFAPFKNLRRITIFQTESDIYKEGRRPYYRALQVARLLAQVSGSTLQAVSFSPRVQDNFEVKHLIKKTLPLSSKIIDLRKTSVVGDELRDILAKTKAKKVLLFLNRKSDKGALVCRTCKVRSYTSDPTLCPNCGSSDVRFQLFNLQTIAKKLSLPPNSQVICATQQIFFQDSSQFDLIVVLSADTYFLKPSYDSAEKTFQIITYLKKLLVPNGLLILQTGFPDHNAIKDALRGDYQHFYKEELILREESSYPPYSRLAKVTYTASGQVPGLTLGKGCQVFGPFDGSKFPYFIVRGSDLGALTDLKWPWKLDIDPVSL